MFWLLLFAFLFHLPPIYAATPVASTMDPAAAASCHPGAKGEATHSVRGPLVQTEVTEDDKIINGEHVKTVVYKNYKIDRVYHSMEGPFSMRPVSFKHGSNDGAAWITSYHGEPVDHVTGQPAPEFMCHTLLSINVPERNDVKPYIATSQGQSKIEFPPGFAFRTNDKPPNLQLVGMVLNNNASRIGRTVDFRFTIHYLEQAAAEAKGVQPLEAFNVAANCVLGGGVDPNAFACEPAMAQSIKPDGNQVPHTRHWLVPPGRHTYTTDVTPDLPNFPGDKMIHYISMHVHPYAESLELRDKTLNRLVWKGKAQQAADPNDARILTTEHYSNSAGLPFVKGHRYQLIAVYNNRTDHKIDAMAVLWMFVADKKS